MFDSCAVVKHLEREASHYVLLVCWVNRLDVKLATMFYLYAVVNIWSVKLTIMFDSCAVLKHLEREASLYV
jgi:hypothetical protein